MLRQRVAAAFVVLYVVVQLAVPALAAVEPRMSRFGWQMFSRLVPRTTFTVRHVGGFEGPIDPNAYLAEPRAEVDLARLLSAHLCRVIPDALAVRAGSPDGRSEEVACR